MPKKARSLHQELPEFFNDDGQVIDDSGYRDYVLVEFKRFRSRAGITLYSDCKGQKVQGAYKHRVAPQVVDLTNQLLVHSPEELFDALVHLRAQAPLRKKVYLLATLDYHTQRRVLKSLFGSAKMEASPSVLQAFFNVGSNEWAKHALFHRPFNWHNVVISDAHLSPQFILHNIARLDLDYFFRNYPDGDIFHHPLYSFSELLTVRDLFEAAETFEKRPAASPRITRALRLQQEAGANPA
jgi:hypothetical protein